MTAVDAVPVSEWLSLGAQRPVVRYPGTGAGGRRYLARLLVCMVESGVVRPVWRVGSESCPLRMPSVRSWVRRGDVIWGGWRPAVRCASGLPAWLGRWALTWRGCRWWLMPEAARVSWLSWRRRGGRSGCWCRVPTGQWRRAWGGSPGSRGWTTPRWLTWSGACRELVRAGRRCGWCRPGRCRGCQFSGRHAGCR